MFVQGLSWGEMWTIKEAADRAGLSPDVLRAWERRYGVVHPTRTASGYRLYSETDIGLLQAMQRLIDEGLKPREAADHLARSPSARSITVPRPYGAAPPASSRNDAPEPAARPHQETDSAVSRSRLIAAAANLDAPALSAYFDALAARGTFETACEESLFPALRALGEAWADGAVPVAGEHATSALALRWLGAQYQAAAQDARPPRVLVALPPGAHHELGALAHAVALRRNGLDVLYLGPDLPADDLVVAISATGAGVAVLGVVIASDTPAAERVAAAVKRASSSVKMAFGGPRAGTLAAHGTVLPSRLSDSVVAVRALLAG